MMENVTIDHMSDKELISQLAKKIVRHGLSVPAIFFLEMVKYLAFFGSQLMIFFWSNNNSVYSISHVL